MINLDYEIAWKHKMDEKATHNSINIIHVSNKTLSCAKHANPLALLFNRRSDKGRTCCSNRLSSVQYEAGYKSI